MSKVQLPPKRTPEITPENTPEKATNPKVSEKKIQEVINKGGSPVQVQNIEEKKLKNFNILVLESDLEIIGKLCNKRPKSPYKAIGFSKREWLHEAIEEKIDREKKKYGL